MCTSFLTFSLPHRVFEKAGNFNFELFCGENKPPGGWKELRMLLLAWSLLSLKTDKM
jgi:hypothetical protein